MSRSVAVGPRHLLHRPSLRFRDPRRNSRSAATGSQGCGAEGFFLLLRAKNSPLGAKCTVSAKNKYIISRAGSLRKASQPPAVRSQPRVIDQCGRPRRACASAHRLKGLAARNAAGPLPSAALVPPRETKDPQNPQKHPQPHRRRFPGLPPNRRELLERRRRAQTWRERRVHMCACVCVRRRRGPLGRVGAGDCECLSGEWRLCSSLVAASEASPFKNGLKSKVSVNLSSTPTPHPLTHTRPTESSGSGAARGSWAPTASAAEVGRLCPGEHGPLCGSWAPRLRPPLGPRLGGSGPLTSPAAPPTASFPEGVNANSLGPRPAPWPAARLAPKFRGGGRRTELLS